MQFVFRIVVSALAVLIATYLLGGVHVNGFTTALIVALVLAFLNSVVKPIMIILTLPVTIFSMGLFLIVINALMILLADKLVDGFEVDGFWWALIFSVVLWLVTSIMDGVAKKKEATEDENNV